MHVGALSILFLLGRFHPLPPQLELSKVQFDAFRLAPFSDCRMYVIILVYPISLAILTQREYNWLQAFGVPLVHSLVTSSVSPLSRCLATGRAQIATPTSVSSLYNPIENLWPHTGKWCL